jgi:hypothetical protein
MLRKIGVFPALLLAIIFAINAGDARATPIDIGIVNPGFDDDNLQADGVYEAEVPFGWTKADPHNVPDYVGVWNPGENDYGNGVPGRGNVAYIEIRTYGTGEGRVGLKQTISDVDLSAGTYWLQVDVGNTLWAGYEDDYEGFPGYAVALSAGANLLGRDYNTLSLQENQFLTSQVEFTFDSDFSGDLTIKLWNLNLSEGGGREVDFDNVRISNTPLATPEPATMLLLGAGLLGLAGVGRKKLFHK